MYIARSISTGKVLGIGGSLMTRHRFPEMSYRSKELYIRAFGEERYERYRSAVNKSTLYKEVKEGLEMRHTGFHDVESFVWVLFHELLLAWPKDSAYDELNDYAHSTINILEDHAFGRYDPRVAILNNSIDDWTQNLHPELAFLAEPLSQIALYIRNEWAFWPELPEDHAHEALAIMLLEIACMIEERGDIELREEERGQWRRTEGKAASEYVFPCLHDTKPSRKRTRESSLFRASKKLKISHALQDSAQVERSMLAKANKPARQVRPIPARSPKNTG